MIVSGRNTDIERAGQIYHIQTESRGDSGPVVESLIYAAGEILVRMTVSYEELAQRWQLSGDDVHHVLELQHWDLVRKIRHGMLDDDDAAAFQPTLGTRPAPPSPASPSTMSDIVDECDDPGVRELLAELDRKLSVVSERPLEPESTAARAPNARPIAPASSSSAPSPHGRWRRIPW